MKKKDILYWRDRYDKEEDLYNKGDEQDLRVKFQKNRCMTKAELTRVVKWKFQGGLKGRQKIILNHLKNVRPSFILDVSNKAFETDDEKEKIKALSSIKGVGNALSTVILTFFDPQNYGILDIHTWREIFKEKEPKDVFSNFRQAIRFLDKLRNISETTGFSCRDIEKALFKKNLEESGIKRRCRASTK